MPMTQQPCSPSTIPVSSRRRRSSAAMAGAFLVLAALAGTAGASVPSFHDVPTTHPFHEEIGALASGGIALGYPGGTYRPAAPITRQAMAAFLVRGLGRADHDAGTVTTSATGDQRIASVTIGHDASGYLVAQAASYGAVATGVHCPCLMTSRLVSGPMASPRVHDQLGREEQPGGTSVASTSNTWVVPVRGQGETTVSLMARRANATTGSPSTTLEGSLTVQFVPFDATGRFSG